MNKGPSAHQKEGCRVLGPDGWQSHTKEIQNHYIVREIAGARECRVEIHLGQVGGSEMGQAWKSQWKSDIKTSLHKAKDGAGSVLESVKSS